MSIASGSLRAGDQLVAPAAQAAPGTFLETFDGSPTTPQPWKPKNWDLRVHSRDANTWSALEPMAAHHGADCGASPAVHQLNGSYDDAVFQCRDHVMTALSASGYGVIYLTPDHMVDFSSGEAVVKWDMSTFRSTGRDWIDLWVSPYEDQLQAPLQSWLPDLNGAPRNALHLRMDGGQSESSFRATVYRNAQEEEVPAEWWRHYEYSLAPSPTRRDTFELRVSRTHIKFGMPQYNLWWVDADIQDLGWDKGVVQLGHHSYNPSKGCAEGIPCEPNTWHWDNVSISPAVPFSMIKANQNVVDQSTPPGVSFPAGAPPSSRLRFAGTGANLEVSFDDGRTWQPAQMQPQTKNDQSTFSSYFMPVPTGTTRVQFRGQGGWWGDRWGARDISIWTLNGGASVPPVPSPTATPLATATRVPATATRIPATPVPATPVPATPVPATPVPATPVPATPVPARPQFSAQAQGFPATASQGRTVTGTVEVGSATAMSATVDVEIYSPTERVFQQVFENQSFAAGQTRQFPVTWQVPAGASAGTYTIKIGVFASDWSTLYQWQDDAGRFTMTATATATKPAVGATATPAPTATRTPGPLPTATRRPRR